MQTGLRRCAALLIAAVFGPLLLTGLVTGLAAPATAATTADPTAVCKSPPDQDDPIHIRGCLKDQRKTPATAVEGVKISIKDSSGAEVGTATTGTNGLFDVLLPGDPATILGETYTIDIDKDSLPKDAELRNPKQESLKVQLRLQSDVFVTFPIDEAAGPGASIWTRGLQLAVGGLVFSLLLAMAALGLSMIFGTTGLTNFAHGELITFGALVAFAVDRLPGDITVGGVNVTMATAIVVALAASIGFGWLQDRTLWRPLRRKGVGLIAAMIVSIGLSIFLRNVYQYFTGASNHNYSQWTSPRPWHLGSVLITPKDVGVIVFSLAVLLLVTVAVQRTKLGKATRAVADNPALAASSGINVDHVISVVWAVGAGLAGLSGVLLGMTQGFDYQIGFKLLLLVFASVVLGGLGSVWGALLGSLIIGIFIEVSTLWVPPELKFVGALGVLILVLMVRPQGLLGRAERVG